MCISMQNLPLFCIPPLPQLTEQSWVSQEDQTEKWGNNQQTPSSWAKVWTIHLHRVPFRRPWSPPACRHISRWRNPWSWPGFPRRTSGCNRPIQTRSRSAHTPHWPGSLSPLRIQGSFRDRYYNPESGARHKSHKRTRMGSIRSRQATLEQGELVFTASYIHLLVSSCLRTWFW